MKALRKRDDTSVEYFLKIIEDQIFEKEWFKYLVWEDMQDFIVNKGTSEQQKDED